MARILYPASKRRTAQLIKGNSGEDAMRKRSTGSWTLF
jgi:hypothetical protein